MRVYEVPIKVGIIIFPIIALLITLPYMIKQYHKFGSIPFLRTFIIYSFVLYLLIAWFMVILPLPTIETVSKLTTPWTQLIPFEGLKTIINTTNFNILDISTYIPTLKSSSVYTVLFNFVLTMPFGFYLRYYFNRKWWEVIILSFLLSLFFEVTQLSCLFGIYPRPYRLFDVDDLIVNTTGGLLGYLITPLLALVLPSREELDEKAYSNGQRVSYPRRFIATLIDFILVCLISFSGLFDMAIFDLPMLLYCFLLYHILCTIIFNGRTLGKFIVGIRLVNEDGKRAKIYQILLRYTIKYILYFEVFNVTLNFDLLKNMQTVGNIIIIFMYLILFIVYIKCFIDAVRKKPLVYESLSHTKHISTIKNEQIKEKTKNNKDKKKQRKEVEDKEDIKEIEKVKE